MFGEGEYGGGTGAERLLAHELTHVVQQSALDSPAAGQFAVAPASSPLEHEARQWSSAATRAVGTGSITRRSTITLQREEQHPTPEEHERNTNHAGAPLSPQDVAKLHTVKGPMSTGPLEPKNDGVRFVVHDTCSVASASQESFAKKAAKYRKDGARSGPAGVGYTANVSREGEVIPRRRTLFERDRPTATQYERGEDVILQAQREQLYRTVWKTVLSEKRKTLLSEAMTRFGVHPKDLSNDLREGKPQDPIAELSDASCKPQSDTPCVRTMGQWLIEHICERHKQDARTWTRAGQETSFASSCDALSPLLDAKRRRMAGTVNIEILQVGEDSPGKAKPLPKPPYSEKQYDAVANLYLHTAREVNKFPYITTHFWVDGNIKGGHNDPRCFDLTSLYRRIQKTLGHQQNDTYGVTPRYGTTAGVHNVWWTPTACHSSAPSTS